jgi:DNA-binding response OmpR family regulator
MDDDVAIVETVSATLRARGYEVLTARDGNQGLALAERERPDVLVLDMMMPRKSGFLVLERIRERERSHTAGRRLPVVMITGNEGGRHRAYAEMLGVDEYLRKPFALDKLAEIVDRLAASEPDDVPEPPA